jgi:hypothetical protein
LQRKGTTTNSSRDNNDSINVVATTGPNINSDDYSIELKRRIQEQKELDKILSGAGFCCICGIIDPLGLDEHHIAGRKHSDLTITVCKICHGKLSRMQRSYPETWLQKRLSPLKSIAFMLRGIADILRITSDFLMTVEDDRTPEKEETDRRAGF